MSPNDYVECGDFYRKKLSDYAKEKFPDSYVSEDLPHRSLFLNPAEDGESACPRCGGYLTLVGNNRFCLNCIVAAKKDYINTIGESKAHVENILRDFALDVFAEKLLSDAISF